MPNDPVSQFADDGLQSLKNRFRFSLILVACAAVGPIALAAFSAVSHTSGPQLWAWVLVLTLLLGLGAAWVIGGRLVQRFVVNHLGLVQSEMQLRRLMSLSGDWYWTQNAEHQISRIMSPGRTGGGQSIVDHQPFLGARRWEVEGLSLVSKGMDWEMFRHILVQHEPFDRILFDFQPKNAHRIIFESTGNPLFCPETRQFMGYEGVSTNITHMVLNERLLGLERQLLQGVLLSAPIAELAKSYARGLSSCLSIDAEIILGYRERDSDDQWVLRGTSPEFRLRAQQSTAIWANPQEACTPLDQVESSSLIQAVQLRPEHIPEQWKSDCRVSSVWIVMKKATEPGQAEYWMMVAQRTPGAAPRRDVIRVMTALRLMGLCLERRVFEDELLALNDSLEQRIQERTKELTQTNSELEAFTYTVSHDLRAPLRAIDGFSNILREDYSGQIPEDAVALLDRISNNARQMGGLIDGLLDFSRLLRTEVTRVEVDLAQMVKQVLESLDGARRASIDCPLNLPKVHADPVLIQQVWMNLIDNALKFSSKVPEPKVEITCRQVDQGWEFSVADNGAGFDMKYSDKLFNVFERLHHKKDFDGTGVGLAVVKRIIERHGGQIWAQSSPGAGARFTFTLANPSE